MNVKDLTTTQGKDQFYPTPPSIAEKMLAGLDMRCIKTVLEPSAGKGDLIDAVARKNLICGYDRTLDVDFCEIDPYLRQICKYNFSAEKKAEICEEWRPMQQKSFSSLTESEKQKYRRLGNHLDLFRKTAVHCVNDDFLTFRTYKHYDLIVMNPPFAEGDLHLLLAIEMQQRQGGSIVCLLNAETIRNPYTATRAQLAVKLKELSAEIQIVENAFSTDAERKADVDVAIIRIHIQPPPPDASEIWERMEKATEAEAIPDPELKALIAGDYIEQAITHYQTEVSATMELVRQYDALVPYMATSLDPDNAYGKWPILRLGVSDEDARYGFNINSYLRAVRLKYWAALFSNKTFIGRLTSELQEKYHNQINRMADYEFSAFNIKQITLEMQSQMNSGIEKAIMDLFEKLTYTHTYDPAFSTNKHYYNGWVTNKAWKLGKKCIIPTYGMYAWYRSKGDSFYVSEAYKVISDIEKAFDYLDGGRTNEIDLMARLKDAAAKGQNKNIECKYFKVDIYQKNTTHIKFYPEAMALVDRLNIYASQKKGWLPPRYGKERYKDMKPEEKAVVDSFHGDGKTGSGEKAYTMVMANAAFYLAEPTQQLPALTEGNVEK